VGSDPAYLHGERRQKWPCLLPTGGADALTDMTLGTPLVYYRVMTVQSSYCAQRCENGTEAETSLSASDEGVTPPTVHRGTRNGVGFREIGNGTLRHNYWNLSPEAMSTLGLSFSSPRTLSPYQTPSLSPHLVREVTSIKCKNSDTTSSTHM